MMELRSRAVRLRGPTKLPGLLPPGVVTGFPVDSTTHTLTNTQATFTFIEDNFGGLHLDTFTRAGGYTWQNREHSLWNLSIVDTLNFRPYPERFATLSPLSDHLASVSSDSENLTAVWITSVGGESISVTVTFQLVEDWLRINIAAEWTGSPTRYSVDAMQVLPLKIEPHTSDPDDAAVCGAVKGVMVTSPIYKFRKVPSDPDQPFGYFLGYGRNFGNYPSGRTLSMPLWGYYSSLAPHEGWMAWYEDHTEEQQHVYFDSDGHHMCWEPWRAQEDMLIAGNNAATLEISGTYCLRPFLGTNTHSWWDVADHYRKRLDATAPYFRPPMPRNDPSLADPLRGGYLHFHAFTRIGTTEQDLLAIAENLRTRIGLKSDEPFLGLSLPDNDLERPWAPPAPPIEGQGRWRQIVKFLRDYQVYTGFQKPSFTIMPQVYSEAIWDDTNDQWNDKNLIRAMTTSRMGYLEGDTDSTRGEILGNYFAERDYVIDSYDKSTGLLTIVGSFDYAGQFSRGGEFKGGRVMWRQPGQWAGATVDIYPKQGETRPAPDDTRQVYILNLVWYTGDGNTLQPDGGESMTFTTRQEVVYCPHAFDNAALWVDWMDRNFWGYARSNFGDSVFYYDIFPAFSQRLASAQSCNSDHVGWNQLDAGYTPHPKGWGAWWHRSLRSFMRKIIDLCRARRTDNRAVFMAEYLDEQYLDLVPGCLNTHGLTHLFRTTSKITDSQDAHGIRGVPMFPIVHGGRGFGISWGQEMGDLLLTIAGRNDAIYVNPGDSHKVRLAQAYAMATEWPFGFQPLTYLHIAPTNPSQGTDLWDPDQYLASHPLGAADAEVALIRDLFASLCRAEVRWATLWLRNGRMLPHLEAVGPSNFRDIESTVFGQVEILGVGILEASSRTDAGLIWSPASFPVVTHQAWRHYVDNSVCVFFTNGNEVTGFFQATMTFADMDMLPGNHDVYRVSDTGELTYLATVANSYLIDLTLAAYTFDALLFLPWAERELIDRNVHIVSEEEITVDIPAEDRELSGDIVNQLTLNVHIPGGIDASGQVDDGGPDVGGPFEPI